MTTTKKSGSKYKFLQKDLYGTECNNNFQNKLSPLIVSCKDNGVRKDAPAVLAANPNLSKFKG